MYRLKIHTSGSLHQNTQLKNPASSGEQDRDLLTPHTSGDPEPPPQTWGLLPRHAPRPLLCFHSITKHLTFASEFRAGTSVTARRLSVQFQLRLLS